MTSSAAPTDDLALFGSGDEEQAIVWLLRKDTLGPDGTLRQDATPLQTNFVTAWFGGRRISPYSLGHLPRHDNGHLRCRTKARRDLCIPLPPIMADLALAIRRC